jgi:prepilin-type N-terminal cleavage/methylation domain-containing protein
MNSRYQWPSKNGFTLVEVIVSAILFTIIMLFGMSFFVTGNRFFVRSEKVMFAVDLGTAQMERLQTVSWNNLTSTTTTAERYGETFTCNVEVTTVTIGSVKFKYIGSTVTWPSQLPSINVDFVTARSTTVVN